MKTQVLAAVAAVALASAAGAVQAATVEHLDMTFASGAAFSGNVTFLSDFSAVTDVTGVLSGGGYGVDTFDWVWDNGVNFSSGPNNYQTWLMDGPGSGYTSLGGFTHYIQLAYNYSSAPVLTFTSGASYGGYDNYIDYADPMVSGALSAVPEPASWAMMLVGVAGLGMALRSRRSLAGAIA